MHTPQGAEGDAVTVRAWRTAWPAACRRAEVPGRLLHDCRRTGCSFAGGPSRGHDDAIHPWPIPAVKYYVCPCLRCSPRSEQS